MPPKKSLAVVPFSQPNANIARELRRILAEMRTRGIIQATSLPSPGIIQMGPGETPRTVAQRAIENVIPEPITPAEQTARPGLIRRAIRYATNRLADSLEGAGRRRAPRGTGRNLAREIGRAHV